MANFRIDPAVRKTALVIPKAELGLARPSIRSRCDLPFVDFDPEERICNWSVPHDPGACWHRGVRVGHAFFAAVAELARCNPKEAVEALQFAPNTPTWRSNGWGIECGFSEMVARAAVAGLLLAREE